MATAADDDDDDDDDDVDDGMAHTLGQRPLSAAGVTCPCACVLPMS